MKIFGKETDNKIKVDRVLYKDELDKKGDGIIVSSVPEYPEPKRGSSYDLYYDKTNGSFFFEEVPRELTYEERIEVLEEKVNTLMGVSK